MEVSLRRLEQAEGRYNSELDTALVEYKELTKQTAGLDADELIAEREAIRPTMTQDAIEWLKTAYGKYYDYSRMRLAQWDVVYIKMVSQLAGDRMHVANAAGCSSAISGCAPILPYWRDSQG